MYVEGETFTWWGLGSVAERGNRFFISYITGMLSVGLPGEIKSPPDASGGLI